MNFQLVYKSKNAKVGPIPATTSNRGTCPPACPLADEGGCYAEAGYYTRLNWNAVDQGTRGLSWNQFVEAIKSITKGTLWRHNIAGDLVGKRNRISAIPLRQLIKAAKGTRGFTYTHYPLTDWNVKLIREANRGGFTVNVSANTVREAVEIRQKYPDLPVVTVLPIDSPRKQTVENLKIAHCPATYMDGVTCKTCGLCQRKERDVIVGFPAHGSKSKQADLIAKG